MSTTQPLKGFRDFLPEQMAVRSRVINVLKSVFEKYGFAELQTPTLEYAAVLLGKSGAEAEKLMYLFTDPGGREVGLRYELTISLARVLAQYPNLPKPFKRYQIQPVFRAEKPQKGRYREIYQCDVDTLGTASPLADAEILAVTSAALTALGFSNFVIRVNSRQILAQITDSPTILQTIDKLDKKPRAEVEKELANKSLSPSQISDLFSRLESAKPDDNLQQVIATALKMGVKNIRFDPYLVRGLDYYTGAVFETAVTRPKIGSVTGGGRYDRLVKQLGGPDIPAVGSSFGLDRICDVIEELQLWPDLPPTPTRVLVTVFSPELLDKSIELSIKLREAGGGVELYPDDQTKLEKQLAYAARKKIPFVAIVGPEEKRKGMVTIRNMQTGEQKTVTLEECLAELAPTSSS